MTTEVLQSFASELGRRLQAHDAAEGTTFASIPIRPVVGKITDGQPAAVGMYLDDAVTVAQYGGEGMRTANVHFVIGARSQATTQALQDIAQGLDRFAGKLPMYSVGARGSLTPQSGRLLNVFSGFIISQIPDVEDGIFTSDLTLRVSYAVESAGG